MSYKQDLRDGILPISELLTLVQKAAALWPNSTVLINRDMLVFRPNYPERGVVFLDSEELQVG